MGIHSLVVDEYLGCFHHWLLWIMLPWVFVNKFFNGCVSSSIGYIHRIWIVESYCIYVYNYENLSNFSRVAAPSYIPTINIWKIQFFHIPTNIYYVFLIIAILVGVKQKYWADSTDSSRNTSLTQIYNYLFY